MYGAARVDVSFNIVCHKKDKPTIFPKSISSRIAESNKSGRILSEFLKWFMYSKKKYYTITQIADKILEKENKKNYLFTFPYEFVFKYQGDHLQEENVNDIMLSSIESGILCPILYSISIKTFRIRHMGNNEFDKRLSTSKFLYIGDCFKNIIPRPKVDKLKL
ncbi:TPA_asm: M [Hepatica betacytorhabdovirus 1]|nr:TPA_asm: M [Hepatica betacytorhabdovirus 1]